LLPLDMLLPLLLQEVVLPVTGLCQGQGHDNPSRDTVPA
jgi:hypothetical protein